MTERRSNTPILSAADILAAALTTAVPATDPSAAIKACWTSAVDGHIEGPLAALAVLGAQLGPVLHVPVHEAKIVVFEGPVRFTGAACGRQAAQAFGFQDAVDRVAVKMGQKVGDPKCEIIQGKAGRTP